MSGARWALMVHGGAKTISDDEREAHRQGCLNALQAGREVLVQGGTAVDAVVAAIRVLEEDPTFNAGHGAVKRTDGSVQLDAAVMDGSTLDIGAVAAVQGVPHPVEVARRVLDERQVLLVGEDASRFAAEQGLDTPGGPAEQVAHSPAEDTVGCVALDLHGHVAAGTSTGGTEGQPPGRVGDSPAAGSGFYADDLLGAVAASGDGEKIVRVGLARQALELLGKQTADQAVGEVLATMSRRVGGEAGLILLTPAGEIGWDHSSQNFAVAWQASGQDPQAALERNPAPHTGDNSDA
ncbi:isoaspartyl peptidase/L-asparaginase family protein [Deinococcus sonorensis]|uniref:Isoaspartyl peptidase/L-asparaginase family protein n=2 Tax=Deinococcus sonorensis TaxID=309891 RepID=A0AAU7UE84_9DEIO